MKTIIQRGNLFALLYGLLLAGDAFAQSLPPLPPMPQGQLLDAWPFDGTNFLSLLHRAPISLTNVALVPTWAGNGLQVDSTNAAWITYPVVETNGKTNLNCSQGTIEMWFSPDWNTSDGLGAWGTILEAGNWNTNVSEATGAWVYRLVTDSQESRAMVARSRALCIGGQGPSNGQTSEGVIGNTFDLHSAFGFAHTVADHSAQWTRPIQTALPYYKQILIQIQPAP